MKKKSLRERPRQLKSCNIKGRTRGGGGIVWGVSGSILQVFSLLGRSRRVFLFAQKNRLGIFGKTIDFYKLLTFLGAPAGFFFSAQSPFFDFGGCSGVHLCHKISILGGLLGNLGYLGN